MKSAMTDKAPTADENLITFTSTPKITSLSSVHHDSLMMTFDRAVIAFKIVDQLCPESLQNNNRNIKNLHILVLIRLSWRGRGAPDSCSKLIPVISPPSSLIK